MAAHSEAFILVTCDYCHSTWHNPVTNQALNFPTLDKAIRLAERHGWEVDYDGGAACPGCHV